MSNDPKVTTIWKFRLTLETRQKIELPPRSVFLHIGHDFTGSRCLWYALDPKERKFEVDIIKVGTGWDIPPVGGFLGTIIEGEYVWHYFTGPGWGVNEGLQAWNYWTKDNVNER